MFPRTNPTICATKSNYLRTKKQLSARIKHLYFDFKTYMFRFQSIHVLFLDVIGHGRNAGMIEKPNMMRVLNSLLYSEKRNYMI